MRHDYDQFVRRGAEVVVVGPDSAAAFRQYWSEHDLPFIGLPDPEHRVADLYAQEVTLLKLGRMPAEFVIDRQGRVRFQHYARHMADLTSDARLLAVLDALNVAQE